MHFGRDSKASRGVGRLHSGKKKGFRCALLEAVGTEELEMASKKQGVLCGWIGLHIRLSLVGSELKVGTKIREAVRS